MGASSRALAGLIILSICTFSVPCQTNSRQPELPFTVTVDVSAPVFTKTQKQETPSQTSTSSTSSTSEEDAATSKTEFVVLSKRNIVLHFTSVTDLDHLRCEFFAIGHPWNKSTDMPINMTTNAQVMEFKQSPNYIIEMQPKTTISGYTVLKKLGIKKFKLTAGMPYDADLTELSISQTQGAQETIKKKGYKVRVTVSGKVYDGWIVRFYQNEKLIGQKASLEIPSFLAAVDSSDVDLGTR